jgi:hypothetical protein
MKTNYSKTDLRHWANKVAFHTAESRTYSVHIQFRGERKRVGLHTADKDEAAAKARNFYLNLRANGWEIALARRKGAPVEKSVNVTIGQYVEAVKAKSLIHAKTIESYAASLRKIAADIADISHDGRARSAWRTSVDAIKLDTLTAEKIESWRADFIKRGSINPLKEKSARVSANSSIGRARSLFGAEVISRVRDVVEIPSPVPFAGVKVQKAHVSRYRSGFNVETLLESAREELAISRPEQYKIFLLGAMAGLRRNEIDVLPWTAFQWNEGVIRIETTEFYRPKSHSSEGDVLVDPELMQIFRGYYPRRKSEFVIESDSPPPPFDAPYGVYRCQEHMRALLCWLRSKGVNSKTPLHTLRKEFGSLINARYGLTAASEQLRHGGIAVTAAHYVENKRRPVLGLGHLLNGERTIIPIDTAQGS